MHSVKLPIWMTSLLTLLIVVVTGCDSSMLHQSSEPTSNASLVQANDTRFTLDEHLSKGNSDTVLLHHNSERTLSNNMPSATGKDGQAVVSVEAFRDKYGVTTVTVTSSELSRQVSEGTITKLLFKALDSTNPDEKSPISTRNFNSLNQGHTVSLEFSDLDRHQPLFVQANVKGIIKGTAVVRLTELVKLLPDPSVDALIVPESVQTGQAVVVESSILELNGDVGASFDCVLYVDGVEHDRIPNVMVEASSGVSCAFMPSFAEEGSYLLEAAIENISPQDYDTSNNSASAQLEVVSDDVNQAYWSSRFGGSYTEYEDGFPDQPPCPTCFWWHGEGIGGSYEFYLQTHFSHAEVKSFPVNLDILASVDGKEIINLSDPSFGTTFSSSTFYDTASKFYSDLNAWVDVYLSDVHGWSSFSLHAYAHQNVYYVRDYWNTDGYVYTNYVGQYNPDVDMTETELTFEGIISSQQGSDTALGSYPLLPIPTSYDNTWPDGSVSRGTGSMIDHIMHYGLPD